MKPSKFLKGSEWQLTSDCSLDGRKAHAGTSFVVTYPRKHGIISIKITNDPDLSEKIKVVASSTGRSRLKKQRFSKADIRVPYENLGEPVLLSLGDAKYEYYLREIHSGNLWSTGAHGLSSGLPSGFHYPDFDQGKFFVSEANTLVGIVGLLYNNLKRVRLSLDGGAPWEIVEYDPMEEQEVRQITLCPDWFYNVMKLRDASMVMEPRGHLPKAIRRYTDILQPRTGRLTGIGVFNGGFSETLFTFLNEHKDIIYHSYLNNVIGFTNQEDLTLMKIILAEKMVVIDLQ